MPEGKAKMVLIVEVIIKSISTLRLFSILDTFGERKVLFKMLRRSHKQHLLL